MDFKDFIALVKAGYTKADIDAMIKGADPIPVAEPTPEPVEVVTAAEIAAPADPEPVNNNSELLAEVRELKTMLQRQALINDGFKTAKQDDAVSILASVINPPTK